MSTVIVCYQFDCLIICSPHVSAIWHVFQIWFHNVPFRQALYDWDPEEDEAERENDTLLMAER